MSPVGAAPRELNASLVQCVGHSLVTGFGLDDASLRASSRLAGIFGSAQEWNQSIAGAVLGWCDQDMAFPQLNPGGISWLANRVTRYPKLGPYDGASDVVLMQFGKNDMAVLGQAVVNAAAPTAQGLSVFKHAMKTAIQLFRASSRHYLGSGASSGVGNWDKTITLPAGVWTVAPNGAYRQGIKGASNYSGSDGYRTTPTTSAQVVISIPSDFQGTAVTPLYVMFVANPATTAATITASGAATGTYDLKAGDYGGALGGGVSGVADNTFSPTHRNLVVWRFTGSAIAAGAGTLTLTTSAITGGNWGFAEWGIEAETPPLIAVLDISRDLANGVGASALYSNSSDASHVTWNAGIQAVVDEFRAKDGYTNYVPVDTLIGGNGQSGARGVLNGAITTGSPANGGTLNVTSSTGAFPTSGTLAVNSAGGVEFISWTGASGNPSAALTGVTRGAYGSTILAGSNGVQVGQVATTKIQNFANDMVHWSERAQSLVAQEVYQKLRPYISDLRRTSRTVGPGRVDARCIVSSLITNQLLQPATFAPILFDVQYIDTVNMHDPSGATGSATPNSRVYIKSDGLYAVNFSGVFSQGSVRSSNAVAASGKRYAAVRRNGLVVSYQVLYPTVQDQNPYITTFLTIAPPHMELRAGDYIDVIALQDGGGASTTLTTANATTTAPNTYVIGSTNDFYPNDYIKIDSEVMRVGVIISATQLIVRDRGQLGTAAAAHNSTGVAITNGWNVGKTSTLNGALTNVATSVPVAAANFLSGDYVRVDDEVMVVTAGSLTTTLTVTRGQLGTTAVSHLTAAPIFSGIGVTSVPNTGIPYASPTLSVTRLQAI